ncbi:MAG: riboflavin synthase [bacterium]|nr:riboflavin synthase [bacterium]
MFTGIIQGIGSILRIKKSAQTWEFTIASKSMESSNIGDSIAVNGVCLTITKIDGKDFSVDVINETLQRTNLGLLRMGDGVNIERPLRVGDQLSGHFVLGHIDNTGTIISTVLGSGGILEVETKDEIMTYIVEKGSIAVDGVSLTVAEVYKKSFKVALIPHTTSITTLRNKKIGDIVNLEVDILGKHVAKILKHKESKLSLGFLEEKGII